MIVRALSEAMPTLFIIPAIAVMTMALIHETLPVEGLMGILSGIILLGVLIAFHELGHFLFAKALGVRVLVFSIGFGPKLLGFKKDDTEYRLSVIPLGGYVRMFGETLDQELTPEEKKLSFMHKPIWRKSLIAFAGPLFNFILPVILLFFIFVGKEQVYAPRIGTLIKNGAAEKAGLLPDDEILSVNNKSVTTFNDAASIIAAHPNEELKLNIKRVLDNGSVKELTVTVKPEAKLSQNPLEKDQKVGRLGIMPAIERPVVVLFDHSPLKKAGLNDFDEVIAINEKPIKSMRALQAAIPALKAEDTIDVLSLGGEKRSIKLSENLIFTAYPSKIIISNKEDQVSSVLEKTQKIIEQERAYVERSFGVSPAKGTITEVTKASFAESLSLAVGDRIVAVDGEPLITSNELNNVFVQDAAKPHILGVLKKDGRGYVTTFRLPSSMLDTMNLNSTVKTMLGISTIDVFKAGEILERTVSPLEALKRSTLQTIDIGVMTVKSLWLLVRREVPASQIGGPIMLFDVAHQAAKKGLEYYIFIMCLISVNLGLLNLVPIPGLDGGHLLLFGIEAVQRKPLTMKTRAIATQVGIAILLFIMAFAIFNDVARLFK